MNNDKNVLQILADRAAKNPELHKQYLKERDKFLKVLKSQEKNIEKDHHEK
jgi:hypothetical protein